MARLGNVYTAVRVPHSAWYRGFWWNRQVHIDDRALKIWLCLWASLHWKSSKVPASAPAFEGALMLQALHLDELVEMVRYAVMEHAGSLLRANPNETVDYIALDLPCTFFMLGTSRCNIYDTPKKSQNLLLLYACLNRKPC